MKKNTSMVLLQVLVLSLILIFTVCEAMAGKNAILQVQSVCPTRLQALGTTINWVADNIAVASEGSLKIKVFDPGKLVPPHEILGAVSKGMISGGYTNAADWAGKLPAAALFGAVPFGPDPSTFISWFYYGNGMKLYQELYDLSGYNVKVLLCGMLSPETAGWFNKKIESNDDLKGLRMRFLGMGGNVMQKVGASVTLLPMAETFAALEKNALDGAEICTPSVDHEIGLYKIAKYNYFPGWHQPATTMELLINKDFWAKLTPAQQRLLEITCKAATIDMLSYSESIQGAFIKKNEAAGVENMVWSKEQLALFEKAWLEVVAEESAKDEFFKKVWTDLDNFRIEHAAWEEIGYLPRQTKIRR